MASDEMTADGPDRDDVSIASFVMSAGASVAVLAVTDPPIRKRHSDKSSMYGRCPKAPGAQAVTATFYRISADFGQPPPFPGLLSPFPGSDAGGQATPIDHHEPSITPTSITPTVSWIIYIIQQIRLRRAFCVRAFGIAAAQRLL